MSQMASRTLDQERAEHALKQIRELEEKGSDKYKNYVSYVSALPATIVTNGLGQALASLLAKAKGEAADPHYLLYSHVASWLCQKLTDPKKDKDSFIDHLMEEDQHFYIRAQAEAIAYLNWLKQFARAYLREPE
jgi:CRISPR-associated protein Cmr5